MIYSNFIVLACLSFTSTAKIACLQSGRAAGLQTGIVDHFNRLESNLSKPYLRAISNEFTEPELIIMGVTYKALVTKSVDINLNVHFLVDSIELRDSIGNYQIYFKWRY